MMLRKLDVHMINSEITPVSISLHKTNTKWIKDLTLKLLEENIASILHDTDIGKDILNNPLFTQELKPKLTSRTL